jgi:NAD(P)-dependent dehydrogenase (short-subunit alcohol dehydrogenase family)
VTSDVKNVAITGSTRGIGYGLADALLSRNCRVVVSGRSPQGVEQARKELSSVHGQDRVLGVVCDVRRYEEVLALWDSTQHHFGRVDIWVNNAGIGQGQTDFWDHSPQEFRRMVQTNIVGAMHGGQVALSGMITQGFGSLYNMEGLGSDGRWVDGLTLYGSTKRALRYLTDGWARETKGTGVIVGALLPGMVVTGFLTDRYAGCTDDEWAQIRRICNIIADHVETVTPWMADKVLANTRNGARFRWLGPVKLASRFILAPLRRRDLFADME